MQTDVSLFLLFYCVAFSEVWSGWSRAEHQDILNSEGQKVKAISKDFSCSHLILSAWWALVLATVVGTSIFQSVPHPRRCHKTLGSGVCLGHFSKSHCVPWWVQQQREYLDCILTKDSANGPSKTLLFWKHTYKLMRVEGRICTLAS